MQARILYDGSHNPTASMLYEDPLTAQVIFGFDKRNAVLINCRAITFLQFHHIIATMNALRHYVVLIFKTSIWCLAAAVLAQNIILIQQNRNLKMRTQPKLLVSGTRLPAINLRAATMDGLLTPVNVPSQKDNKLLLITFSPTCPICRDNLTNWLRLAAALRTRDGWRVIWLSRDSIQTTREYCTAHQIPSSLVLADPPYRTYAELGLDAVPQTVVITDTGTVDRVWIGSLTTKTLEEMSAYFNMAL